MATVESSVPASPVRLSAGHLTGAQLRTLRALPQWSALPVEPVFAGGGTGTGVPPSTRLQPVWCTLWLAWRHLAGLMPARAARRCHHSPQLFEVAVSGCQEASTGAYVGGKPLASLSHADARFLNSRGDKRHQVMGYVPVKRGTLKRGQETSLESLADLCSERELRKLSERPGKDTRHRQIVPASAIPF